MMKPTLLVEDIEMYAQNIVDTVREPLLILDTTLRVRSGTLVVALHTTVRK